MESGLATAEGSNPSEINMDQMVSVKVDGVTSQITIRDAVNGYATKQKMTEATTRASELQKQVDAFDTFKAQLQRDPQGTITGLAERFNVTSPEPLTRTTPMTVSIRHWRKSEINWLNSNENSMLFNPNWQPMLKLKRLKRPWTGYKPSTVTLSRRKTFSVTHCLET